MVLPLPVTVHGPITHFSPSVRVTGVVAMATVEVFADGNPIGYGFAVNNGELRVDIDQPDVGAAIIAIQSTTDGPSAASPPVPVVGIPDPLPVPVFVSPLSSGMSKLQLAGLVPGAKIELRNNGAVVGWGIAIDATAWVDIDYNADIAAGAPMHARQTLDGNASDWAESLGVVAVDRKTMLAAPGIGQPVSACETSIMVAGATPTADLSIDNEGTATTWYSPTSAYAAWGAPPFKPGKMVARQAFPRLGIEGAETTIPVGPAVAPAAPIVQGEICPKLAQVKVSNLSAGGLLTLYTRAPDPANPATIVETSIGIAGINASVEPFNLPPNISPTTAAGQPVTIVATQTRCDLVSDRSVPAGFAMPAAYPHGIPMIAGPLYDCARVVVMQGAHVGATVELRSAATGLALGDPVLVATPTVFYKVWFPLVEDDKVFIRQSGCDADGESGVERVFPLDNPFPDPEISAPVRPAATAVYAKGFLRGARAHLLVNGVVRSSIDTPYSDAWLPTGLPLLVERDHLTVVQTLCRHMSNIEQSGVNVTRGELDITVVPKTVERGRTAQLLVTATDRDTNVAVPGAQVLINGNVMGSTGTHFPFSPAIGLAAANGVVKAPLQYHDAAFSVALINPAPVTAKLHLKVGPPVPIYNTLALKSASWTVATQWGASQTFSASGASVTLTLPKPPAGGGNIVITLATKWDVAGNVYGSEFYKLDFDGMMWPAPATLVWDGAECTVGFWVQPEVSDLGGTPWLNVVAYYQGIQ